jgi:hypothetical protein
MVLTEDYNMTKSMLWEFHALFSVLNVHPELVNELRSWILKMPDAKYMDVVTSEAWNNRVEALRVLGEIIGKITPVGTPNSPVPDVWRPCYFMQTPTLSPTLKVAGFTYHRDYWDNYVNYKYAVRDPDTKHHISWTWYQSYLDTFNPFSEAVTYTVTEPDYTEKFSFAIDNPYEIRYIWVDVQFQMRSYDGKPIYAKWQFKDSSGNWVDIYGEDVETRTSWYWHGYGYILDAPTDRRWTTPYTIRLVAKRGNGSGGEIKVDPRTFFKVYYYVNNFVGCCEYWFEALRHYDRVRVEAQMASLCNTLMQAGMHIYFVKSGESIAGKPENERLCIMERDDVEIVGHIFKPHNAVDHLLFFDHELDIFDYVKYLVVSIDDPSPDFRGSLYINELKITAL